MTRQEANEFLSGLFATWFATQRGREKPSVKDKKDAAIVASSASDNYEYLLQFGYGGSKRK